MPSAEVPIRETDGPNTKAVALRCRARKARLDVSRQLEKQKRPTQYSKASQKLSPKRTRMVLDVLRGCPVLDTAAAKVGIHRKTLTYWLKCSKSGQDSYDIEHQGVQARLMNIVDGLSTRPTRR